MILIINTSFVKTKLRRRNEDGVGLYPAWADQARIPRSHLHLKLRRPHVTIINQSISTELRPFVIIQFYFNKSRVVKAGSKLLLMILRLNVPASNLGGCLLSFN